MASHSGNARIVAAVPDVARQRQHTVDVQLLCRTHRLGRELLRRAPGAATICPQRRPGNPSHRVSALRHWHLLRVAPGTGHRRSPDRMALRRHRAHGRDHHSRAQRRAPGALQVHLPALRPRVAAVAGCPVHRRRIQRLAHLAVDFRSFVPAGRNRQNPHRLVPRRIPCR